MYMHILSPFATRSSCSCPQAGDWRATRLAFIFHQIHHRSSWMNKYVGCCWVFVDCGCRYFSLQVEKSWVKILQGFFFFFFGDWSWKVFPGRLEFSLSQDSFKGIYFYFFFREEIIRVVVRLWRDRTRRGIFQNFLSRRIFEKVSEKKKKKKKKCCENVNDFVNFENCRI